MPRAESSMMTKLLLAWFLLFRAGLILASSVIQTEPVKAFNPGDTVILRCSISDDQENYLSWFKQSLGQAPVCILTLYTISPMPMIYGEFKNDTRFMAKKSGTSFVLTISDAKPSDSGLYYCGVRDYNVIIFGSGVFLMYEGANYRSHYIIQQPVSERVQPEDNVTLQCTVHTESCAGEYSIYWFRHGSGESHPGVLYNHGGRSDQCEKSPGAGSPTQSCVYNLPKRNLSLSDAGTYYCAVATCGQILFGNGTKLDIEDDSQTTLNPILLALVSSNIIFVILFAFLVGERCKNQRSRGFTNSDTAHQNEDADIVNYAAVSFTPKLPTSRRTRGKPSRDHAVYSEVRSHQQD